MTDGREGHPEGNLPIESYFPKDVLPTAHFLARLPGFDKEYSGTWPAKEISSWNGKTEINGVETVIRIGHTRDETKILLDKALGQEIWIMEERFSNVLQISLNAVLSPVTILLPNHLLLSKPIMWTKFYFKGDALKDWKRDRRKPSECSLITEGIIDIEKSNLPDQRAGGLGHGIESAEQALEALRVLKQAIIKATPLEFVEDPPPNPDSNSLISRGYFEL